MRFIFLLLLITPVLLFLNTGFLGVPFWRMFQTIAFSLVFSSILVWPQVKKYAFLASGFFIVIMVAFFIAGQIESAELLGSSSFGILILVLISYLPQFIKKGYVEKI